MGGDEVSFIISLNRKKFSRVKFQCKEGSYYVENCWTAVISCIRLTRNLLRDQGNRGCFLETHMTQSWYCFYQRIHEDQNMSLKIYRRKSVRPKGHNRLKEQFSFELFIIFIICIRSSYKLSFKLTHFALYPQNHLKHKFNRSANLFDYVITNFSKISTNNSFHHHPSSYNAIFFSVIHKSFKISNQINLNIPF